MYLAEKKLALEAVRQACFASLAVRARLCTADTQEKSDRSPVTVADYASQVIVMSLLRRSFPTYGWIAEEDSKGLRGNATLLKHVLEVVQAAIPGISSDGVLAVLDEPRQASSARCWVLDPVDGTLGYLRAGGQYAIAHGLRDGGRIALGVLGCPVLPVVGAALDDPAGARGVIQVAVIGEGAFQLPLSPDASAAEVRLRVAPAGSPVVMVESVESSHSSHEGAAEVRRKVGAARDGVKLDSMAKYALVARGDATVYYRQPHKKYVEKVWDHSAGSLIVAEAGGKVTDFAGKPLDFSVGELLSNNRGIVATNGDPLHSLVLASLPSDV